LHQDQVAAIGKLGDLELRGRPGDLAFVVLGKCHPGTVYLEVVEVVGVQCVYSLRVVGLGEMFDGSSRRVPRVVPAPEGHHHHRVDQIAQVAAGRAG